MSKLVAQPIVRINSLIRASSRVQGRLDRSMNSTGRKRFVTRAESEASKFRTGSFTPGQAQFSRFYPPEARDFQYARHIMLAVDGTHASEEAARWTIKNVLRSGDLLHLLHVAIPQTYGLYYLGAPGTELTQANSEYWERRNEFWDAAIKRTERMLDGTMTHIIDEDAGTAPMTPFRPPIELDCIIDQTWEPVGQVLVEKAQECNAEIVIVVKHHKNWIEKVLTGSVSEYVIENAPGAVLVYHARMPGTEDLVLQDDDEDETSKKPR